MKKVRQRLAALLVLLILANGIIWLLILTSAGFYPLLAGLGVIAYGFGLRHAVDADHIASIDNTVRKLMQDGKRPVAVGFFFSLGHSIVVIGLSSVIIISANFVQQHLPALKQTGSVIGTLVSALFLIAIGIINLLSFKEIIKKKITSDKTPEELAGNKGFLTRLLKPFLKMVKNSWQMVFIGFLFGLSFDTASEIGLLTLSAVTATQGVPVLTAMLIPLVFTAGMSLIDSLAGVLMLGAYGWAFINPDRKLYYNLVITLISGAVALLIGGAQLGELLVSSVSYNLSWIKQF